MPPLPQSIPAFNQPIPLHPMLFAPDLITNTIPIVCSDMNGMYPTMSGARMLPGLVAVGPAVPGTPLFAFYAQSTQGAISVFVATATNIYRLAGTSWLSVGSGYNASAWSFTQAGDDTIATDGVDVVQVCSAVSGTFAALGGSPPIAQYVTAVDPGAGASVVVILANLQTDATGWVASGPGNDTVWTLNVNDLSASGFLQATQGPITGLKTLRTYAVAFKTNSLYLGAFIGSPFVWSWQPVSRQIGCASNNAIVDIQDMLVFPGPDDFYQFDGVNVYPIPNQLREWFFGDSAGSAGYANPNFMNIITSRYDPNTGVVFWHFSSVNASPAGALDTYVCWNRKSGRWGVGHFSGTGSSAPIQATLLQYGQSGMTYDQFTSLYLQYQNLPHKEYGDPFFGPAKSNAQAVIIGGQLYTYTGAPTLGYFQTGDIGDPLGMRLTRLNRAQGLYGIYPTSAVMNTFSRTNLGQLPLTARKTNVPLSAVGNFDFMQTDYYHQLQFLFTSDAELQALIVDEIDAGSR